MDVKSIDVQVVADLFLLLLIGIGPKIALKPQSAVQLALTGLEDLRLIHLGGH